jgi:CheY-like chemotaxis protein
MTVITCINHPVSVLFVDDNETFLDSVAHDLRAEGRLITYSVPHKAVEALKQSNEDISSIVQRVNDNDSDASSYLVDFRVNQLPQILYNPNRNHFIAVAVIDYDMPGMNGVELATQFTDSPIGKIILTMKGDEKLAVQAFNKHLIDQFIFKTPDSKMYKDLLPAIEALKLRYFDRLSRNITDALGEPFKKLLKSANFQKVFDQVYKESSAIEYYLIDQHGSFLFLDKEANSTWLIVRDDSVIQEQIAYLEDIEVPATTIDQLKDRSKLLFMPADEDADNPSETLSEYLFDAKKLSDDRYYSVAQGKITKLVDWNRVTACKNEN